MIINNKRYLVRNIAEVDVRRIFVFEKDSFFYEVSVLEAHGRFIFSVTYLQVLGRLLQVLYELDTLVPLHSLVTPQILNNENIPLPHLSAFEYPFPYQSKSST